MTEKRVRLDMTMSMSFVGERARKFNSDNQEKRCRQIKPNYRWYLVLLVRRLNCINLANGCCYGLELTNN